MNKKACFLLALCAFYSMSLSGQNEMPDKALLEIYKGKSHEGLLSILRHYDKPEDSLKRKAAHFLLANLPFHQSSNYFWRDSNENKVAFDELNYADFHTSINAFKDLQKKRGKMHPEAVVQRDIDSVQASRLIRNIDEAFAHWNRDDTDFETFCEYLLPYRIDVEPLQDWRQSYRTRFSKITDPTVQSPLADRIKLVTGNINLWFVCTYKTEKRNEPLPRLGAMQLLHRKKGPCEDVAAVSAFALRSLGIPATVDVVPFWATSTGGHVLNCAFEGNKPFHYDALSLSDSLHEFIREPAKVFRTTFSAQAGSLATLLPEANIPPGVLRVSTYKDVTHEYWPVRDLSCRLNANNKPGKIVYACVYNGGKWRPVWWGRSGKDSVSFSNVCKGAVFLPKYYENGKLEPAGYPVASGYQGLIELKPSPEHHRIHLKELPGYLKFRAGKTYTLYYYDRQWNKISEQVAGPDTNEMFFDRVPKNSLLILLPNDGEKKERPFTITEEGERFWW